jgi:3'-phosphoadenosine 5'-phosphosulfate sulfotransferase (PAPS reductase)/FAD synthetase
MRDLICWWSGGITSAVAGKKAQELYPNNPCRFIMLDTANEDEDTYRFKKDCEEWYGQEIEILSYIGTKYKDIQDVWKRWNSLNIAKGAVCSAELKKNLRINWQKDNDYLHQVFGFEFDKKEFQRAISMTLSHPETKPIFPLLLLGLSKKDCIKILEDDAIDIPRAYKMGFNNNNCLKTGCVQGGVGYWQKMKRDFPEKFEKMAKMEHYLTDRKQQPVTMLKDQSSQAKKDNTTLVFLKKHPDYPLLKSIDDMKGRAPEPLTDCNGFCGMNDLTKLPAAIKEINFEDMM